MDLEAYRRFLPPALREHPWRAHPLDGKLLLFDRATGLNALLEGEETRALARVAPRALLIAVTNHCNLDCPFCYRDRTLGSAWTYGSLLAFCQAADAWGVLEVAFGGGEPMVFPGWQSFIQELHATTGLGINFTTNGVLLSERFLRAIHGQYGQIRLSLYDDNDWQSSLRLLAESGARFGINWLITPAAVAQFETQFFELMRLGVRDFLLLSYKGPDRNLHLSGRDLLQFSDRLMRLYRLCGPAVSLKLDDCWGQALPEVPRLFSEPDCGAGDDIVSITSDKQIKPCSFHHLGLRFNTLEDVRTYWQHARAVRPPAQIAGCARLPQRGQTLVTPHHDATFSLALV